jgi:hypothetical protein
LELYRILRKVPTAFLHFSFPSGTHDQATLASKRKGLLSISERSNQKAFVASGFTNAAEEIIGELQALFACHNAGTALSAKAVFKPTRKFHTATGGV